MKKIIKDRKTLYIVLSLVMVCVFTLTIAYAALNAVLEINGNAEVVASTWDIKLANPIVTSGSVNNNLPTILSNKEASFTATLTNPGDFYEFSIDVVNNGSIDAMIDSVTKTPTLSETQAKYLNYIVEYQNGESINTKQLVEANSFVRLKVKVEFRKDLVASDLPTSTETLNLAFTVNYVQAEETGTTQVPNNGMKVVKVVKGDGTNTSDEICIGEECFYVMYSDETTVTMLAKYNLYVGGEFDNGTWTAYGEEATGKQDSTMIGYGTTPRKGTSTFSNTNYWYSTVSSYPAYVYNENSLLYNYVENYKIYLSTLGVVPIEARLITIEEFETLGCSGSSCTSAPSWVYATSYWTGSAAETKRLWRVYSSGALSRDVVSYENNSSLGVRPVITISI